MRFIKIIIAVSCMAASMLSCKGPAPYAYLKSEEISVARLKELYRGTPVVIEGAYVITGTVVSSDEFGNFYKTIVVEDSTAGIEIKVDMENIFRVYRTGSKVRVHCKSLALGAYGGLIQLGTTPSGSYETGYINSSDVSMHIRDTGLVDEGFRPPELGLGWLTADNAPGLLCRKVAFRNVWFTEAGEGTAWCDDGEDTDRILTDDNGNVLIVRTSSYARFASLALPGGNLYIEGVLSWFNGNYQLRVINESAAIPLQVRGI